MSELPPLPSQAFPDPRYGMSTYPGYTADQMREYAKAAIAAAVLKERADAERYRAFFDRGLTVCFGGEEYHNKADCDAAIDAAIRARADGGEGA